MAEQKQCPLKVASPKPLEDTACKPDCAWYLQGKHNECAIKHLAKWIVH